jgi:putative membrane protein
LTDFLLRLLINALAIVAAVRLVPDVDFAGEWWQLAAVAAIFALINTFIRPIVRLLSLPANLFAFGLVGFFINTALLLLLALVSAELDLGFRLAGWPPDLSLAAIVAAFFASLVVSIVSAILGFIRVLVPRL